MTHKTRFCPENSKEVYQQKDTKEQSKKNQSNYSSQVNPIGEKGYKHRFDRHIRPYGERISETSRADTHLSTRVYSKASPHHSGTNPLPPAASTRTRDTLRHDLRERLRIKERITHREPTPAQIWREIVISQEGSIYISPEASRSRHVLMEHHTTHRAPQLPLIPSMEEVLEDLREVTIQYTNVEDPIEREARLKRVLEGETRGLMAETAMAKIWSPGAMQTW